MVLQMNKLEISFDTFRRFFTIDGRSAMFDDTVREVLEAEDGYFGVVMDNGDKRQIDLVKGKWVWLPGGQEILTINPPPAPAQ